MKSAETISLNGRDYIWARSIEYWFDRVNDLPHELLGFGANGPYRSGASLTYSDRFDSIVRNPELTSMHNSFLQQLFDGGFLGWLLLMTAIYWASARLAKRRRDRGNAGVSAIVAMTALILSGMTEISLAPEGTHETFWLLMVLVGVACQASDSRADSISLTHRGDDVAAAQNTRSIASTPAMSNIASAT
jgi:O-antigen ligase